MLKTSTPARDTGASMRPHVVDIAVAGLLGAIGFVFRFNTLGGGLGGFTNDQFAYMARGRQILAGELPIRDFADPGLFLMSMSSAAAQLLDGYNLRSEALLTVASLAAAAALTYLLAVSLTGSRAAALFVALFQIGLEPRHYSYPKLLLYSVGVLLAWRYVARGTARLAFVLGVFVGIAGLFRNDHAVYLGGFAVLTMAIVHGAGVRTLAARIGALTAGAALVVLPFLAFVQHYQGVGEYLRAGIEFSKRDAARTSFAFPRLAGPAEWPVQIVEPVRPPVRVNVRWRGVDESGRAQLERQFHLAGGEARSETTWTYELRDTSASNIEALVTSQAVADTHGVDRQHYVPSGYVEPSIAERVRLNPAWRTQDNATAFLYYVALAAPIVAMLAWLPVRRRHPERAPAVAVMVPLLALALALNASFLSRGSTNIRIPDVGVTIALTGSFVLAAVFGGRLRLMMASGIGRALVRAGALLVVCAATASASVLNETLRHADQAGFDGGFESTIERTRAVWRELGTSPPLAAFAKDAAPVARLSRYVNRCTTAGDRLFVLGDRPELYYLSGRLFAGGHASLIAGFFASPAEQALIVRRLEVAPVPLVITQPWETYRRDYKPILTVVDDHLVRRYRDLGDVALGEGEAVRVLVDRTRAWDGQDEELGLPCTRQAAPQ